MTYAEIGSVQELRELLGMPSGRAVTKERTRLHAKDREWLAASPFCEAVQETPETLAELEAYYAPENYAKQLYRPRD